MVYRPLEQMGERFTISKIQSLRGGQKGRSCDTRGLVHLSLYGCGGLSCILWAPHLTPSGLLQATNKNPYLGLEW